VATRGGELAGAWEGTKAYLAFLSEARCEHGNTVMEELTEGGRVEEGWKACRCEGGYGGCIRRRSARGAGKTPAVGGSLVAEAGRARKGEEGAGPRSSNVPSTPSTTPSLAHRPSMRLTSRAVPRAADRLLHRLWRRRLAYPDQPLNTTACLCRRPVLSPSSARFSSCPPCVHVHLQMPTVRLMPTLGRPRCLEARAGRAPQSVAGREREGEKGRGGSLTV